MSITEAVRHVLEVAEKKSVLEYSPDRPDLTYPGPQPAEVDQDALQYCLAKEWVCVRNRYGNYEVRTNVFDDCNVREITLMKEGSVILFESRMKQPPKSEPSKVAPPQIQDQIKHSDDFRSVSWFETVYELTATQAACVGVLLEHWKRGTPVVGEQTILENAEASSERLRDVFDKGKHPAWGTMIVPGRKGAFQLSGPKKT